MVDIISDKLLETISECSPLFPLQWRKECSVIAGGIVAISRQIASLRAWKKWKKRMWMLPGFSRMEQRLIRRGDPWSFAGNVSGEADLRARRCRVASAFAWSRSLQFLLKGVHTPTWKPSSPRGHYSPGNRHYSPCNDRRSHATFRNRLEEFIANDGHHLADIIFKTWWQKLFYISFLVLQWNFLCLLPFL